MKILYSWLMDFIDSPLTVKEVEEKLFRLGFQIESVKKTGPSFEGVVTGEILKVEKHPNADRLSLCEVDTGEGKIKVVCGARNVKEGEKVPFAGAGAKLKGQVLKKAKIRGVESEGMICSARELGLGGFDDSGILILPRDTPVGLDARTLFGREDHVFEIEMLPHQSYCLSHMALAREICSFNGIGFKPSFESAVEFENADIAEIETGKCLRYSAVVIKNVAGIETPHWMKERLKFMDVNPKNNMLIDVSNYVMFELGQPTHCFDLDKIEGGRIKVRDARKGEKIKTLQDDDIALRGDFMVIADAERPVAVAGIIGGANSSVTRKTKNILVESACFDPASVRRTSREISVKTDSSYRFERGTDAEMTVPAALRIAALIKRAHPDAVVESFCDRCPRKKKRKKTRVTLGRINGVLGTDLDEKTVFAALRALDPGLEDGGDAWEITSPGFRDDLNNIQDVAEEVARFTGYDVIPSRTSMPVLPASAGADYEAGEYFRRRLRGLGFCEVYNYDLISSSDISKCFQNEAGFIEVKNPLSGEWRFLRNSLFYGLMKTLKYNLNRKAPSVLIFEEGSVYSREKESCREEKRIAGLCWGNFGEGVYWKGGAEDADFFVLKGVVNAAFEKFGVSFGAGENTPPFIYTPNSVSVLLAGKPAGFMGEVNRETLLNYSLKEEGVWYFEISAEEARRYFNDDGRFCGGEEMKPVSIFPSVTRDISVVVKDDCRWEDVKKTVSAAGGDAAKVEAADVYRGKKIGGGCKSLTVRITFSSLDKTFTDEEINAKMENILFALEKNFSARLRE